ncbi:hypothetical protein [Maribacter dokdonensis]|uniref:hypothetical protein n=1 Tax=Maribacter dokdonensis TaxID=320912 RepID=UPI0032900D02
MKRNWFYLLAMCFLVFTACNSDDDVTVMDELPAISTAGLNTFGCLIDGQVFMAKKEEFCTDCDYETELNLTYEKTSDGYRFALATSNKVDGEISMQLEVYSDEDFLNEGKYSLSETTLENNDTPLSNAKCVIDKKIKGVALDSEFYTNKSIGGVLEIIRIDQESKFISGTFYFSALDDNGQFVNVSDGRFDVTYNNY